MEHREQDLDQQLSAILRPLGVELGGEGETSKVVNIFLISTSLDWRFQVRISGLLQTLSLQGCACRWKSYTLDQNAELCIDRKMDLHARQLFLFLLSPDFVREPFCYSDEVRNLVEKHPRRVWVLPILVRACLWEGTPFGRGPHPILPNPRRPITHWAKRDDAYLEIARGIKKALFYLQEQ